MTGLEIGLLIAVIWLAGALLVVLIHETYRLDELLALALWFAMVPLGLTLRAYRRWAFTCPDCGSYYGDREHYDRHMAKRTHCTVELTEETST